VGPSGLAVEVLDMQMVQSVGEVVWGFMLFLWVTADIIHVVAPRYHERMLKLAKGGE